MSEADPAAGSGIDTSVPHSARIWNYWLGGKNHFPVDREAGDAYIKVFPSVSAIARNQRAFMHRAVRALVTDMGVDQFIDVGTGLPMPAGENTHETAQAHNPAARVLYVDNDPLVLAHARALLTGTPQGATHYLDADMHDVPALVDGAAELLDLDRPVGVLLIGVLGHVLRMADARALVDAIMDRVCPGSYLVIADGVDPAISGGAMQQANDEYADTGGAGYISRGPDEVASFFTGFEIVEPGMVHVEDWRPDPPGEVTTIGAGRQAHSGSYGTVARKP